MLTIIIMMMAMFNQVLQSNDLHFKIQFFFVCHVGDNRRAKNKRDNSHERITAGNSNKLINFS